LHNCDQSAEQGFYPKTTTLASMEKSLFQDTVLKRDNYEEWNQFIRRKLNEVPMMVD
jgi:hypothetical protein